MTTITIIEVVSRTGVNLSVKSPPFRRVLVIWVNVLESDGEMDQIQIEILDAPQVKLLLGNRLNLLDIQRTHFGVNFNGSN